MNRITLRLDERTIVSRQDGLLDAIELHGPNGLVVSIIVGPAGARVAGEAGSHLLAAARRQYIPTTRTIE